MSQDDLVVNRSQILQSSIDQFDASQFVDVRLEIGEDQIKLILETETTLDSGEVEVKNVWIAYRERDNGCVIENHDQQEFVDRLEFFDVSVLHLEHALSTMDVLKKFSLISVEKSQDKKIPTDQDLRTNSIFLEILSRMLASRQKPLKAHIFEVHLWQEPFNNHAAIIMSYLKPQFLYSIILSTPMPGIYLNLSTFVALEQWLNGKEFRMINFLTYLELDAFFHFTTIKLGMYHGTYEKLTELKNHFLKHETPEYFELNYPESFDNYRLVKSSDMSRKREHVKYKPNGDLHSMTWYFPVGDGEELDVLVKYRPEGKMGHHFLFKRVSASVKLQGSQGGDAEFDALANRTITGSVILPSIISEIENAKDHTVALIIDGSEIRIRLELGPVPYSTLEAMGTHLSRGYTTKEITYKPKGEWCIIESDRKLEVLQSSVYKASVVHLECLLRYISVLSIFTIESRSVLELDDCEENVLQFQKNFLESVKSMLRERNTLLKTRLFHVRLCEKTTNEYLRKIMACLDPQILDTIILNGDEGKLECGGLFTLTQWKNTNVLRIDGFYVDSPIPEFTHFKIARVTFSKISNFYLMELKAFFQILNANCCLEINFKEYTDTNEIRNNTNNIDPQEVFGYTDHVEYKDSGELYRKVWYFPYNPNRSYDVRIEYCTSGAYAFQFEYVDAEMKNKKLDTGFKLLYLIPTNYQAMKRIIEKCSVVTILSIRKVCKGLRSFVDTRCFEFPNKQLSIVIDGGNCYLKIVTPDENMLLGYEKNAIGCSFWADPAIYYNSDYIQTRTITGDTPLNVCMSDLGSILKHHKAPMDLIDFNLRAIDDVVILTEIIRETLMPEEKRLKVNRVFFFGIDMKMMTRILSYLDEKVLNAIVLMYDAESRNEGEELDTGRMVKLAQWKNAKQLGVDRFAVSFPIESIGHFHKVKLCFRQITIRDLLYLKEIFMNSSVKREFDIQSRSFDAEKLNETFGYPYTVTENKVKRKKWLFKMLVIRHAVVELDYLERIEGEREITCFKFTQYKVPQEIFDNIPW